MTTPKRGGKIKRKRRKKSQARLQGNKESPDRLQGGRKIRREK